MSHAGDVHPGSAQVKALGLDRADDEVIWSYARQHGLTIVTQDSDYAELASLRGSPPKVIWLRSGNQSTETIARILRQAAPAIAAFTDDPETACLQLY